VSNPRGSLLLAYLLATAFGVSDEDLLVGRTVTISQIGAALPVSFSFAIAPMVLVFLHIYTLVRYDMLAANVRQFRHDLQRTVKVETDRERCRQLLANVEFVGALITPRSSAEYSRLWSLLFFGIVAVFPVVVLVLVQINALRYQSDLITNVQRAWLVLDLAALVWFFSRSPLYVRDEERLRFWRRKVRWGLLISVPALLIGLNFFWLRVAPATPDPDLMQTPEHYLQFSLAGLVQQPLDAICPLLNWGCRFLSVVNRTLVDKVWDEKAMTSLRTGGPETAKELAGIEGVVLTDRSLRFAVLAQSRLYAANLIGANLMGASLAFTNLIGANLSAANLSNADLSGANLSNAELSGANLPNANLLGAKSPNADLSMTDLSKVNLRDANLMHANLYQANLGSADLSKADLSGASLVQASLHNADLSGATLSGANLSGATLSGANLSGANLSGASDISQGQLDKACGTKVTLDPGLTIKPC